MARQIKFLPVQSNQNVKENFKKDSMLLFNHSKVTHVEK